MATSNPLRDTPKPVRSLLSLPSVTVRRNQQPREAGPFSVPVGTEHILCELDGAFWPADSRVEVWLDISEDGGATRKRFARITAEAASLVGGKCSIGWVRGSDDGNQNADLRMWAGISVLEGSPISLAGSVLVEP